MHCRRLRRGRFGLFDIVLGLGQVTLLLRDASEAERTKMREERAKIQTEKDKEIKALLTADQVKLYDEMLKKREEMRRNGQGRMGGPGGQGRN